MTLKKVLMKLKIVESGDAGLMDLREDIENLSLQLLNELDRKRYPEKGYCPVWDNAHDYALKRVLGDFVEIV